MIELKDINRYRRKGRGKVYQFYVLQDELYNVILDLEIKFDTSFDLIVSEFDEVNKWTYAVFPLKDFSNLIEEGYRFFLLRCLELSPEIEITKNGRFNNDYYLYNGLINIRYNIGSSNVMGESFIMLIDVVESLEDQSLIIKNHEYFEIYKFFKKRLKSILKYKGFVKNKNQAKPMSYDISAGIKGGFENGKIKTRLDFVG